MVHDVFISHSAQDKAVADAVCAAFEEDAIRCWVAPRDVRPGRSFPGEITRAIQQSKVMVLIFSRHSNNSEQVLREVQLAVDSHLPIVRLRIEDVTLSDDLRYYLSTPHWLDALTQPLSKHVPPLVAAIKELLNQSTHDAETTGAGLQPLAEVAVKHRAPAGAERSTVNWKPFAIAAAVFAAGLIVAFWMMRSEKKTEGLLPSVQPAPAQTAQPSPNASIQATQMASALPTPTRRPVSIAVVPSPSPAEPPQPVATPPPIVTQANKKGPSPRNNRSWQQWIDEFVHNYIASSEWNDSDLELSFYAPRVDMSEEGWKTADAIRRDVEAYNARWPKRRATIRGDVRLSEKAPNRTYAASFEHDYYVENPARGEWINGAAAVDLNIAISDDGLPKVISEKQKTLRKEKGTMQPR